MTPEMFNYIKELYYEFKLEYSQANEVLPEEVKEHYKKKFEVYLEYLKVYPEDSLYALYYRKLKRAHQELLGTRC
jgi:predicted phosphoadenosine phosphosulfate sulfurtransferase